MEAANGLALIQKHVWGGCEIEVFPQLASSPGKSEAGRQAVSNELCVHQELLVHI